MSVECLQNRPPLVHFMREQGPRMRCGAAVRRRDRCGPQTGQPDPRQRSLCFPTRMETSPELEGLPAFSPSDSTSPVWKSSEDLKKFFFFSKGICVHAYVIKPEFYLLFIPFPVFCFLFGLSAPVSGRKIDCVSWCSAGVSSGYSEAHSFPNFYWIPKL